MFQTSLQKDCKQVETMLLFIMFEQRAASRNQAVELRENEKQLTTAKMLNKQYQHIVTTSYRKNNCRKFVPFLVHVVGSTRGVSVGHAIPRRQLVNEL